MKKLLSILGLNVFGVIVALFLFEIGFRLLHSSGAKTWSDRPAKYFRAEASQTLQDYPYSKEKPAQTYRIAVVGDSYSFAPYMQFTDAFPKKIEELLNLNNVPLKAEVINYGVPAYSTSHEVATVKRAIEEGADLILLQVTLNDPELKPYRPTGITEFGRFGALKLSPLWEKVVRHWTSLGYVLNRLHNLATHREYKKYFIDLFENPRSWKSFKDSAAEIANLSKSSSVKLVAVVFPLFGLPQDENYPFHPLHSKIATLFDELAIPHLDLYSAYEGIPLERLQVIPGVDRHPNEIAHRIAAEKIYDWLEQLKILPPDLLVRFWFKERTDINPARMIFEKNHEQ